jgi:integrase/recombinase XerD
MAAAGGGAMKSLRTHVDDYLRLRRALGYKLERHGRLLPQLINYLQAAGAIAITSELAILWARQPTGAHPRHWAARLAIARGFAAYMHTIDPGTEVPPAGAFTVRYRRPTPYLWSKEDIGRLLEAARTLRQPLKAASFEALFGLLAVSGMRVGEAIALDLEDVDLKRGVVVIREQTAKLDRARLVPLHRTSVEALKQYVRTRQRLCPRPRSRAFFLSNTGTRIDRSAMSKALRKITIALGLRTETTRPRAHDLRHGFAVTTLIEWQRSGVRIDERIAALSTYLGHISPADTYWYLTATPELMTAAAQRLQLRFGGRP